MYFTPSYCYIFLNNFVATTTSFIFGSYNGYLKLRTYKQTHSDHTQTIFLEHAAGNLMARDGQQRHRTIFIRLSSGLIPDALHVCASGL